MPVIPPRRRRRQSASALVTLVAALCAMLCSALAAPPAALASPAAPDKADRTAAHASLADGPRTAIKGKPAPKRPQLTVPGTGEKRTAFASLDSLHPTKPRALPGAEKTHSTALDPAAAAKAGAKIRKTDAAKAKAKAGATIAFDDTPYCDEAITRESSVGYDELGEQIWHFAYLAEMACNFYLDAQSSAAAVVDHSGGKYENQLLIATPACEFQYYYYCSSGQAFDLYGDRYDGARTVEVIYELYMLAPAGVPWGACNPLTNLRYLLCEGLGTELLHIVVGTGNFNTGLAPPVIKYVAMGDSYSSGTGAPPYFGPADCRRSKETYAYELTDAATDRGQGPRIEEPQLVACHGGVINDITNSQYPGVPAQISLLSKTTTRLVTISIGGNDLGFGPKLRKCVTSTLCGNGGAPLLSDAELNVTRGRLADVLRKIRAAMRSDGYVQVLGYPQIFPASYSDVSVGTCPAVASSITSEELTVIRNGYRTANAMIRGAIFDVGDARVGFTDVEDLFKDNHICTSDAFANGFQLENLDIQESFHPKAAGYAAEGALLYGQAFNTTF